MKKTFIPLIAILILTLSCNKKPATLIQEGSDTTNMALGTSESVRDSSILTANISLQEAAELISNFLNYNDANEQLLRDLGVGSALGGTIHKKAFLDFGFNQADSTAGAAMWFCKRLSSEFNVPILFAGVEKLPSLDTINPPTKPLSGLIIPNVGCTFTYDPNKATDPQSIESYLKSEKQNIAKQGTPLPITNALRNINEFKPIGDKVPSTGGKLCDLPFSFFKNGDIKVDGATVHYGLYAFLHQPNIEYIRYYFGYEKDHLPKTHNKIRVILFAVDKDGYNITSGSSLRGDGIILQKSVPPHQ